MRRSITFIFLLFSGTAVFGQDSIAVRDFETWTGLSIRKEIFDKHLSLSIKEEVRLHYNSSEVDQIFTQVGATYNFLDHFRVGASYRLIHENNNNGYESSHRYNLDAGFEHKVKRLDLSYRFRFQRRGDLSITDNFPVRKLRLKAQFDYNIRKWKLDPFFSMEIYHSSTADSTSDYIDEVPVAKQVELKGFEKLRFTLGTSYSMKNIGRITLFYRLEKGFAYDAVMKTQVVEMTPKNAHIIGLRFRIG